MNRAEFISQLRKELKNNQISDIEEIISDYQEHFDYKLDEGYTEEEISKKLGNPNSIAAEYLQPNAKEQAGSKLGVAMGLSFAGIGFSFIYFFMMASVLLLGALALGSLGLGFCLITTINISSVLPSMPYVCSLFLGLTLFALATLAAVGTIYAFLYVKHWGKLFLNWCKNSLRGVKNIALSKHPKLSKKFAANLKLVTIIALIVFISLFAIAYISMCIVSNSFEPWHVWNWFV